MLERRTFLRSAAAELPPTLGQQRQVWGFFDPRAGWKPNSLLASAFWRTFPGASVSLSYPPSNVDEGWVRTGALAATSEDGRNAASKCGKHVRAKELSVLLVPCYCCPRHDCPPPVTPRALSGPAYAGSLVAFGVSSPGIPGRVNRGDGSSLVGDMCTELLLARDYANGYATFASCPLILLVKPRAVRGFGGPILPKGGRTILYIEPNRRLKTPCPTLLAVPCPFDALDI